MNRPMSATRLLLLIAALAIPFCWLPCIMTAQSALSDLKAGAVQGTVFIIDSRGGRSVIAGVRVRLEESSSSIQTVTDERGNYGFAAVAPATYQIEATAPGLVGARMVTVVSERALDVPIELKIDAVKESVTVRGNDEPAISTDPSGQTAITRTTVLIAPNKYDRFDNLLPLIPGVLRGPDGLINMKGARSSQGGSLLNSASVTDPATGNAAMSLPIDVVESVKVIPNPYDPEYGRLSGAVSSVQTVTSNFNSFHLSVQNLLPRARKRSGDFIGVESATPRLTVTGPLVKDKIAFTQSFEYRFLRIPVSSLPQLQRDMKLEGFNSFSQFDVNLTQRQSLTASFALYPQKFNYLGLNTFTSQTSTPDLHQRGYMASIQHRYATGSDSLLLSQFSYKRFDADVTANSNDPYQLLIETTAGGFFNRQNRRTYRTEWQESYQFGTRNFFGSHQLKAGIDFAHSDYNGRLESLPVTIIGVSNLPIQRIDFGPASRFNIHQNETAWFLADTWAPWRRLTLDLGLRLDRDSITGSINPAPRAGFALLLTNDAKTLLKGGVGLFYDRVPLNIASFPSLPDRTIINFASSGGILDSRAYVNTIGRLRNPRSVAWNVELDRQLTSDLTVRAGFQQRNTARDFLLTPGTGSDLGILSLSNVGRSFYREFQVSGRYKIRRDSLNASYVRIGLFLIARPRSRLSPLVDALGARCPRWLEKGKQIEVALRQFKSQYPSSIRRMFLLDAACQVLLGAEVVAAFWCLKIPFHVGTVLAVEGASRAIKIMAGWMPARIGADESGIAGAFFAFGLSPASGLTLALARRSRDLLAALIGLSWLALSAGFFKVSPAWIPRAAYSNEEE